MFHLSCYSIKHLNPFLDKRSIYKHLLYTLSSIKGRRKSCSVVVVVRLVFVACVVTTISIFSSRKVEASKVMF